VYSSTTATNRTFSAVFLLQIRKSFFIVKIVFFGTPEFATASLKRLVDEGHDIAAVVTMPDKTGGRGHKVIESDVKKFAVEHRLPLLQPVKLRDPEFIRALEEINADLFIVIAFRMMPKIVWDMPRLGTFNLHASLLPKYRGAAPINRALMNGETETGVTTFFLNQDIDTGPIIDQRSLQIGPDEYVDSLYCRLMNLGADMVLETVHNLETGSVQPKPQPEGEHIPAPKIFREDCHLNLDGSARLAYNQIRGLSPYPAVWHDFRLTDGNTLTAKILKARVADETAPGNSGTQSVCGKHLLLQCKEGVLEIDLLQPNGKRPMTAEGFLAGYKQRLLLD